MAEAAREQRLRELFDRAVSLPVAEREQVIAGAGDEVLAERLRALLVQDMFGTAGVLKSSPAAGLQPLRRIGRYEVLRELGSGGMGTVVLAWQHEPVERLVALKILRADFGEAPEAAQRFAIERQALAMMNHPGIARIFDGGTTDDGLPYLVMEYVRGEPITDYCDRRQLDGNNRIDVFVKVCEAMQHAHQKGVLHRDLKPANVLVTEEGGSAQPKVIDFGVARALAGTQGHRPLTSGGLMVGTFVYMSPEQADPGGQDVDTRADIYSLGVLLYQLLTGELPLVFDPASQGLGGFQRALLETPPPRASTRVQELPPEKLQRSAHDRSTTPTGLPRQLQGDLDWILLRALEKDRNRRYATAAELAADLQRHRRCEPVEAGPPTLRYRVTTFVRRHRVAVVAGVLVWLALVVGLLGATSGMLAARKARDVEVSANERLTRQLLRQRAVSEHCQFVLFYGDAGLGSSGSSLREILDLLTASITARLADRPVEEAAVRSAMGRAYLATGEPAKAEVQLRAAWQLVLRDGREEAAVACQLLFDLSRSRRLAGGTGAGIDELVAMLELGVRAVGASDPELAQRLQRLVVLVQRPLATWSELQSRCDELLDLVARMPWDVDATRIAGRLLSALGVRLEEEGLPGSQRFLDRLEAVARQALGEDVDFLLVLGRFAEDQLRLGRFADARRLAAEVMLTLTRLGFAEHWLFLRAERVRGLALALGGEPAVGENALVALQRRLWSLPPGANEQARAAANVLAELCARLAAAGQLEQFFVASLERWQRAEPREPADAPWWPADADNLPAAAIVAARTAVEQAIGAAGLPQLKALHGSLLLRSDQWEAATAALESALAALPQPTPELQADAAIARARSGQAAAAAALVAELRARCALGDALLPRCQRALQRVTAAGLR